MKLFSNSKVVLAIFLALFLGIYSRTFFHGQLFRSDDLELHGARLANYYLALKQGQFPPRWAPNLNYSFGYPVFTVSYLFPYAASVVWYIAGLNIEWSINLTTLLAVISAVTAFFAIGVVRKKTIQGALAAVLFLTAPYIMASIFIRGALAEVTFFGLLPWVFFGIDYYYYGKAKPIFISLYAIIITIFLTTHPPSIVISLPIIISYVFVIQKQRPINLMPLFKSALIGIMVSQIFWLPFLVEKKFVIAGLGFSTQDYYQRFPQPIELLWSKWSYGGLEDIHSKEHFSYRIGLGAIVILIISFLTKSKKYKFKKFWTIIFIISTFLLTPYSKPIWDLLWPMQSVQFPWRLLWIPAFATAHLILNLESTILNKNRIWQFISLLIVAVGLHHAVVYAKPAGFISNPDHDWLNYPHTSSSNGEFNPIWFDPNLNLRLTDDIAVRPSGQRLFDQNGNLNKLDAKITILHWTGTQKKYQLETTQNGEVVQKTAYFPGFQVTVNGQPAIINYTDPEFPGRIIFPIKSGISHIEATFTQTTWDRRLGTTITLIGVLILILHMITSISQNLRQLFIRRNKSNR